MSFKEGRARAEQSARPQTPFILPPHTLSSLQGGLLGPRAGLLEGMLWGMRASFRSSTRS